MKTHKQLGQMKKTGKKIAMVTAYDYPSAKQAETSGVDMILVGDSLGMVVLGYESTIPVTVDDMIHHGKAVKRGAPNTYLVVDMPFMSYHVSMEQTLLHAKRMFQETSAHALKVEGAGEVLNVIQKLTFAGIPVVAHLGLTPQSVHVLGGYKVQGKELEAAQQLIDDAKATERSGAIALVLECVPSSLAALIAEVVNIPVIGIGAGPDCDGQVLVYHDLVTYGVDRLPKFAKAYTNLNSVANDALSAFVQEVKSSAFPSDEHGFSIQEETIQHLYGSERV
ncbi:3-methyl-2-oxobutanoate hydroxymethyltransferase [Pontibacillus halophilus JSM 076056 = DSM 19796]|uniref:3-methyl-2-oxobutanoate hydroxymethyltransferase n=1 Tax=Pontibacillus halophilus JSM 076056 = DSM 19796 TaxID=1385510 RepID=A0A0A5GLV8_9BACI|nr:3-methyl-2-oxobutanoate hydroxymethyltransferase [Pontibacillus halophilus]KGX92140.1 3-methyl-2-oxobutanoate hydroxymethyltransferase [Pontibacillus halophilus JSM 076056 = DSM 19796]